MPQLTVCHRGDIMSLMLQSIVGEEVLLLMIKSTVGNRGDISLMP